MKGKILTFLGAVSIVTGIILAMCLPYLESFPFWNARMGILTGFPMIVMGIAFIGMVAEEHK